MNDRAARPRSSRLLANIGSGYVDTLVAGVIYLVMTPIIIDRLGSHAYAVWLLGNAITFYLRLFDCGFGEAQVRLHARTAIHGQVEALARLTSTVLAALLLTGTLAALLGLAVAALPVTIWAEVPADLAGELRTVIGILAVNLLVAIPESALRNIYAGEQRLDVQNVRDIALRIVAAVAQLWLLTSGYGIVALAVVELVVSILGVLLDTAILTRLYPALLRFPFRMHRAVWRRIRRFSLWATIGDIVEEGTLNLDEILIALLLPLGLLTPYALAWSVGGVIVLATAPIGELLFPMAASMRAARHRGNLRVALEQGTRAMLAIALPLAVFIAAFGAELIGVWVPEAAGDVSDELMVIIAASGLVSAAVGASTAILFGLGRARLLVALTLSEALLELTLVLAFAPTWHLTGVALACLIANVVLGLAVELPIVCRLAGVTTSGLLLSAAGRLLVPGLLLALVAVALRQAEPHHAIRDLVVAALALGTTWIASMSVLGTTADERRRLFAWVRALTGNADRA